MTTGIGSEFTVGSALAYDVIQNTSTIRVSLTAPNGTKILNNASADEIHKVVLDQYGLYKLTYTATDSLGLRNVKDINVRVRDEVPPTFTLSGTYRTQYRQNNKITILDGVSEDNYSDATTEVFLYSKLGMRQVKIGESIVLSEPGDYELVYRTTDAARNVTRTGYAFTVS